MAEVEIPYGNKVIRLRIDVISVLSKTPATAPTAPVTPTTVKPPELKPVLKLKPKV